MTSPSSSDGSLTPPVEEPEFELHFEARERFLLRLQWYQPLSGLLSSQSHGIQDDYDYDYDYDYEDEDEDADKKDSTISFLKTFFKFLPVRGQVHLADDINHEHCQTDAQLRDFVEYIKTALLRPLLVVADQTPRVTATSPSSSVSPLDLQKAKRDEREKRKAPKREHSTSSQPGPVLKFGSATHQDKDLLSTKQACLQRDQHRCTITRQWGLSDTSQSEHGGSVSLDAVHIIPFGLGNFREDGRRRNAQTWKCLYRYFPNIEGFFHRDVPSPAHTEADHAGTASIEKNNPIQSAEFDVNRLDNLLTIDTTLRCEFSRFAFILEEESSSSPSRPRYQVVIFPERFTKWTFLGRMPKTVTFEANDANHSTSSRPHPFPNRELLAVHAALGNILHATGEGVAIEETMELYERETLHYLARDGSTDIGGRLSFTNLAALANQFG
ncbi:hypothetical protein N7539_008101 [Penicillium diatomitis]|uniref:HNH nuclease domain-containing protein n=1 Tax=Penicillium diatomitis TaxID=2819901 RepID=A0A9W9WT46_9EURO|nr:uncharacterized protein N7539_008101 [Penicillium diatomitis]KAJ5475035.1 hypothetical protein N7539_008101 [Penicillium diatomitis]